MDSERGWRKNREERYCQEEGQREGRGLLSKLKLTKEEFLKTIKEGRARRSKGLTLYFLKGKERKVGISISKRIKGSVLRNKIKRRIREIVWKNINKIPEDNLLVIIAHEGLDPSFCSLEVEFLSLL